MWANPMHKGWGVMFAGGWRHRLVYYELLRDLAYRLSLFDPTKDDALSVNDQWNGVYSTVFEGGKLLLYNPTDKEVSIDVLGTPGVVDALSLRDVFL